MDEVGLGKQLQAARKKGGLTQQDLCHKAGLSYSTLAKIERGAIKAPSIFTIQSIASALGLTLSELMGDLSTTTPISPPKYRSKSGVRFVYFDVNGCLVRFFNRAFTKLSADTGATADSIEAAYWRFNDAANRGEISMKEFNKEMAKHIGLDELDWQKYYLEAVDPIEEMHELLNWASQYYHVGLLSNSMPGLIRAMKAGGQIPDIEYAAIIDSSEVGMIKPEAGIYEIAQAKTGVLPTEILLVDDARANITAAGKFGWHVLWFNDNPPAQSIARIKDSLEPDTVI